jgi:hypothetical protein
MPGGMTIWQGLASGLGGALLAAMLSVSTLQERSQADQRQIQAIAAKVDAMLAQMHSLNLELARQGVQINELKNTRSNERNSRN